MKQFKYLALAALVAFAACDEGTDITPPSTVTGDIVGTVTIEGAPAAGYTVTLSSGVSTVTAGDGTYSFTGVAAGAYTVVLSGIANGVTFSSPSAAVVVSNGVVTANFAGVYVRTSAIFGSVTAGGVGLPNLSVTIVSTDGVSASTTTGANGQYSFSGLRADTYTVTVAGIDGTRFSFPNLTGQVPLGTGESRELNFAGALLATSTISGTLFIDGNDNLQKDVGEPPLAKAGITVALEVAVGDTIYTTTDANGMYSFPDLAEGTYKVIVDGTQAGIPGAYAQSGDIRYLAVATSGAPTTVNFPFVVTTQYVWVYGMLGIDNVKAGVAPIKNWVVTLYPTDTDARKEINKISTGTVKTDATGLAVFKFPRTADYSPNAAEIDGIVFAKVAAPAGYSLNGEKTIEIPWVPFDSLVMAPDTFDATYNTVVVKIKAQEIDGDSLPNWQVQVRPGKDSTSAVSTLIQTNSHGYAYLTVVGTPATFPDTAWFRLHPTQPDGGHSWKQTPSNGDAVGRNLRVIWDGTVGPADTLLVGIESVNYLDTDLKVNVHREQDDTMNFTAGDNLGLGAAGVNVLLYEVKTDGTKTLTTTLNAATGVGSVTFPKVDVSKTWEVRARAMTANYKVLNDTAWTATILDGSDQTATDTRLKGSAGASSFMVKTTNNVLKGHVRSRYGASMVPGLKVWAVPTAMNIQGTAMRVDTTRNNGLYILDSLREGPYTVTVTAGDSAYVFLRTLKTTPSPASSGITSVSADNSSPTTGVRDLQGVGDTKSTDFEAYRSDTKFSGIIVNDRDTDLTTIDPGEALAGAVINLFRDDDGSATPNVADTLIGTATTDANGAYSFTGLVEGRYTAVWGSGTPDNSVQVMTKLSTAGAATTQISATPLMALNVKQTGNLPAWNYANPGSPSNLAPANFTFLYANTVVQGTVLKQGTATPVPGMSITLQKCYLSTANAGGSALTNVSGPRPDDGAATTCTSFFAGSNTVVTDAAGNFQFANLREGVYRVTPAPGTVPPYASFVGVATGFAASPGVDDGRSGLFLTVGSGDIESLQFDVY